MMTQCRPHILRPQLVTQPWLVMSCSIFHPSPLYVAAERGRNMVGRPLSRESHVQIVMCALGCTDLWLCGCVAVSLYGTSNTPDGSMPGACCCPGPAFQSGRHRCAYVMCEGTCSCIVTSTLHKHVCCTPSASTMGGHVGTVVKEQRVSPAVLSASVNYVINVDAGQIGSGTLVPNCLAKPCKCWPALVAGRSSVWLLYWVPAEWCSAEWCSAEWCL
jgi:hypothetical protein